MNPRLQFCLAAVVLLAFLGCALASVAPADVLSRSSLAQHFVSIVSIVLPLEQYGQRTPWPEVAKLYYAVVWLSFPFALIAAWEFLRARDGKSDGLLFRPRERLGVVPRLVLILLAPLWLFLAYVGYRYWGGNTRLFDFATSFWQMSLLGILAPVLTALALALGVGSLVKALLGRFL